MNLCVSQNSNWLVRDYKSARTINRLTFAYVCVCQGFYKFLTSYSLLTVSVPVAGHLAPFFFKLPFFPVPYFSNHHGNSTLKSLSGLNFCDLNSIFGTQLGGFSFYLVKYIFCLKCLFQYICFTVNFYNVLKCFHFHWVPLKRDLP